MAFTKTVPKWNAEGVEPPDTLKNTGFTPGYKPPADYFNWFWHGTYAALIELQGMTPEQIGAAKSDHTHAAATAEKAGFMAEADKEKLDYLDKTKDADKSVASAVNATNATNATTANKIKNSIVVRLNGGSSEGTNKFTFDGSAAKNVNITPEKVGAVPVQGTTVGAQTLTHAKSGTVHTLTGLSSRTGLIPVQFLSTAAYTAGDTFTIDGAVYTGQLISGEALETNLFISGVGVEAVADVSNKTLNFKAGGGLTNGKLAATTAIDADVVAGKTYYSGNKVLKTGSYIKPTQLLVGNDVLYVVESDDDGNAPAITATTHDIRKGKTAVIDGGFVTGDKNIPAYETTEGKRTIPAGSAFEIPLEDNDMYDYTALQCIICPFNDSVDESVAAEKVVIDGKVYPAGSVTAAASVTKDAVKKVISLGVTNNTENSYILRYFTYKEID